MLNLCCISTAKNYENFDQDVASFREHGGWAQMKLQIRGITISTNGNLIIISTTERRLNSRIQRYRCLPKMCIIFVNQANKPSKKNTLQQWMDLTEWAFVENAGYHWSKHYEELTKNWSRIRFANGSLVEFQKPQREHKSCAFSHR
jgi:hypothetical protein